MTSRKKIAVFLVCINILLITAMFFARPIAIGYSVYGQIKQLNQSLETYTNNLHELRSNLAESTSNLSSCYEFSQQLLSNLQQSNNDMLELKEKTSLLRQDNKELGQTIADRDAELGKVKENFDALAANMANNLCCKTKVDNPEIKYYRIEGNKVICLTEGTIRISCPS